MKRIFYLSMVMLMFFTSIYSFAGLEDFNVKNYLYDDKGNPVFIKIYISKEFSNQDLTDTQHFDFHQLLNRMSQEDQTGTYVIIPIKKKKKQQDADEEEDGWVCPYCNTYNEASRNCCKNPDCVLYRKGNRNWQN